MRLPILIMHQCHGWLYIKQPCGGGNSKTAPSVDSKLSKISTNSHCLFQVFANIIEGLNLLLVQCETITFATNFSENLTPASNVSWSLECNHRGPSRLGGWKIIRICMGVSITNWKDIYTQKLSTKKPYFIVTVTFSLCWETAKNVQIFKILRGLRGSQQLFTCRLNTMRANKWTVDQPCQNSL